MKKIKKPVFFIVAILILGFSAMTFLGISTQYGDITSTYIRGLADIRWGIDIKGGVDVTFTSPDDYDATDKQIDAAKSIVETRMVANNITDYEVYVDYATDRIIVRFPWQSGDEAFDPEHAVKELGETALLTFREGVGDNMQIGVEYSDEELAKYPIVISGSDVESANAYYDSSATKESEKYGVSLSFYESGKQAFADATEKLLESEGSISIWMDNTLISAPSVNAHITDGKAQISGSFDADSANALANKINGGALPFKLVTDSFSTISPTLGTGALSAMAIAGLIAFALIMIFMILMYRVPGCIAVIGLIGQVAGMFAAITGFFAFNDSFTLTIPGIAGIILSVGMGVDANIITAERIKEEVRRGKSIDGAVEAGYKRAFSAILDGNLTMVIIAIILMGAFGTPDSWCSVILTPIFWMFGPSTAGTIYSFGYTLLVGVIMNFIFGVFCSRLMTYSLVKFKPLRKVTLYGGKKNG